MSKIISKKILPKYYQAVISRHKNFEIRKDEDDIQVGDRVILKEYENGEYTGNCAIVSVSYVLRNVPEYGLKDGYCIFSWKGVSCENRP